MNLRCVLVTEAGEDIDILTRDVELQGCEVVGTAVADDNAPLYPLVCELSPDLVLIVIKRLSTRRINDVQNFMEACPLPVLIFTQDQRSSVMREAFDAGVADYVMSERISSQLQAIIRVAMVRFDQQQALRGRLREAEVKLAERKLVERAKGILMQQRHCTEDEAYRELANESSRNGKPLVDIAAQVITRARLLV